MEATIKFLHFSAQFSNHLERNAVPGHLASCCTKKE